MRTIRLETGKAFAVVTPPFHSQLTAEMVARILKAQYWQRWPRPSKAVVLLDADSSAPIVTADEFRADLLPGLQGLVDLGLSILVTCAKWHLEAWFFAHGEALRQYLGRDLGAVQWTLPDDIVNPKLHLKHLLASIDGRVYTSQVAGEIARSLDPSVVLDRSPSFRRFDGASRNGQPAN